MRIRIIKPGIFSTIQDKGRGAYLSQAVPVSGAMDMLSAKIANMAVGNPDDAAVIEFTYAGASFITESGVLLAYAGDGAILHTGEKELQAERPIYLPAGTQVTMRPGTGGSRTYVAVSGGWDVPKLIGSRSTYVTAGFGGLNGRILQAGDILENAGDLTSVARHILKSLEGNNIVSASWRIARHLFLPQNRNTIRVVPANEFTWFTGNSILSFLSSAYTVNRQSSRMGCHLDGTSIKRLIKKELLSTAVTPGTIQVNGNGQPIMLLADCQTTGGYPRIAQVANVDLPLCGQLKPGDVINFQEISQHEAEKLFFEREHELKQLDLAIKSKYL